MFRGAEASRILNEMPLVADLEFASDLLDVSRAREDFARLAENPAAYMMSVQASKIYRSYELLS